MAIAIPARTKTTISAWVQKNSLGMANSTLAVPGRGWRRVVSKLGLAALTSRGRDSGV